ARCSRAGLGASAAGLVESGLQEVVQGAEADLVAGGHGASGSDQVGAGTALLGANDRSQHAVDRGVQSLDDRMVLVEPRAVDFDDELGARLIERVALQL